MLREIGYWDHCGDEVSEACDERYGAGSWAAILAMMESKAQPKGMQPCQGMNCGATDGKSHSPECFAEHAATVDPGVGERHREARYAGYKGEPFPRSASEDERAAWMVGFKARLPATQAPAVAQRAQVLARIAEYAENLESGGVDASAVRGLLLVLNAEFDVPVQPTGGA